MVSILNYVFGNDGAAGIATISGDAGGFSYIDEPLEEGAILSAIEACLGQEHEDRFDDEEIAELKGKAARNIEKIHAKHVERYTVYRACR